MNCKKNSNRISHWLVVGIMLWSIVLLIGSFYRTKDMALLVFQVLCLLMIWGCVFLFFLCLRKSVVVFSDMLCKTLDDMMHAGVVNECIGVNESLFDKILQRLVRLYEMMIESRTRVIKERADLQELISNISHQVKTPIANLKLMNGTMLEQEISKEKQKEFLLASEKQLDKLEFLMQAMIKTSRMEAGMITLDMKLRNMHETLAAALGGIILTAEKKNISISVECPEDLLVKHDKKWTVEALFNVLDNAVKYTDRDGKICVNVISWDMYVKIDMNNTGKVIPEKEQGKIFQRFYRENDNLDVEGIGLGLYLAREIITKQGGYITVKSDVVEGTTFSIFLPLQ